MSFDPIIALFVTVMAAVIAALIADVIDLHRDPSGNNSFSLSDDEVTSLYD